MRHLCQVCDNRIPTDILAQCQWQAHGAVPEITRGQDLAQHDFFAVLVGQFDPDHAAARHGGHTRRQCRHRARDIVRQTDNPARLEARCRFQLVHGDNGAGTDGDDFTLHAIVIQHVFQHARVFFQGIITQMQALDGIGAFQQVQRRQLKPGMCIFKGQCGLCFGLRLFAGLNDFPYWLLHHLAGLSYRNLDIVRRRCIFHWHDVRLCQPLIFRQIDAFATPYRLAI